jgi:membrane protease YdiL (CAAX protease family)
MARFGRSVWTYFTLTFCISWVGAAVLAGPRLLRGEPFSKFDGLMIFPAMLLGPALAGLGLTLAEGGLKGLGELGRRMVRLPPARWLLVLLIPPGAVAMVLLALSALVSPSYRPGGFFIGAGFGLAAGLIEEIGWSGYVTPRIVTGGDAFGSAVLLGLLWGVWHLPALDFLGAATPHGPWLLPFAAAFIFAMSAMRVLIVWAYVNTGSVLMAQLMHAASTGALVAFSPQVKPAQEALWYSIYGAGLWILAASVVGTFGRSLTGLRRPREP